MEFLKYFQNMIITNFNFFILEKYLKDYLCFLHDYLWFSQAITNCDNFEF